MQKGREWESFTRHQQDLIQAYDSGAAHERVDKAKEATGYGTMRNGRQQRPRHQFEA